MVLMDEGDRRAQWMNFISVASFCMVLSSIGMYYGGPLWLILVAYFVGWVHFTWMAMSARVPVSEWWPI